MESERSSTPRLSLSILPTWECVFTGGRLLSDRWFVRVPENLARLGLGPQDVAMELRAKYRYWEVHEFSNDEERAYWWTSDFPTWSFFYPIPVYLVILFVQDLRTGFEVVNTLQVVPNNTKGGFDVRALGIWIESDEDLERFKDTFGFDDFDEKPEGFAQFIAQQVFDSAIQSDLPTPMDYVCRYWHAMTSEERRDFLADVLGEER